MEGPHDGNRGGGRCGGRTAHILDSATGPQATCRVGGRRGARRLKTLTLGSGCPTRALSRFVPRTPRPEQRALLALSANVSGKSHLVGPGAALGTRPWLWRLLLEELSKIGDFGTISRK